MPPSQFHPKLECRNCNFTLNWGVGIVISPNSGVSESELGKKVPVGIAPSIGGVRIKNGMSQIYSGRQIGDLCGKFSRQILFPLAMATKMVAA